LIIGFFKEKALSATSFQLLSLSKATSGTRIILILLEMQPQYMTALADGCLMACVMAVLAYRLTLQLIPNLAQLFIRANLVGQDLNKVSSGKSAIVIPEATGLIAATVLLMVCCLFIPFPFLSLPWLGLTRRIFPIEKVKAH
jgi:hypothetical protein